MSAPGNAVAPWVRLWRVEHSLTGLGPFSDRKGMPEDRPFGFLHGCPSDMPVVWADTFHHRPWFMEAPVLGWYPFGPESRFAFANRLALRRWVPKVNAYEADAMGYVARLVTVPDAAHVRSCHQAIYDSTKAIVLRSMSLVEAVDYVPDHP